MARGLKNEKRVLKLLFLFVWSIDLKKVDLEHLKRPITVSFWASFDPKSGCEVEKTIIFISKLFVVVFVVF